MAQQHGRQCRLFRRSGGTACSRVAACVLLWPEASEAGSCQRLIVWVLFGNKISFYQNKTRKKKEPEEPPKEKQIIALHSFSFVIYRCVFPSKSKQGQ